MKNSGFTLLSVVLLLFFSGLLAAQEIQGFTDEFGIESLESLEDIMSAPETASSDQEVLSSAVPSSMNMLGGFMQFLFLVAVSVAALIAWLTYRNRRAEQFADHGDDWG